jgi:FG-GAP-like repeat/Immunoglobulin I-set domain
MPRPSDPSSVPSALNPALLCSLALAAGVPLAAAGPLCFAPTPYGVGIDPSCVAIADLNGDGRQDMAVANHDPLLDNRIAVLINNGDGTFAPSVYYDTGDRPYWIDSGDIDGDLDPDLAVTNYFGTTVSVFLNNGDGTFAPQVTYEVGNGPGFVAMALLDADTDLDLAVGNIHDYTVSILMNNGDGTFAPQVTYPSGPGPYGIVAAYLDNDAALDLAISNHHLNTVSILLNNGDGTFMAKVAYTVNQGPVGIDAADLDQDGDQDLAAANTEGLATGTTLSVLLNNGDGTFAAHVAYTVPIGPYTIKIVDFNADGWGDLTASAESGFVMVLLNNGDGTFAPSMDFTVGELPVGLDAGDLDGNGTPEVAVTCYNAHEVWVLFNQYVGISDQPDDVTVTEGAAASFTVVAAGPGPFSYQWRRDGADLIDGGVVGGATTDTLTIDPVSSTEVGSYDVIVSNDCGPLTSAAAALTIEKPSPCPADFDGNGVVNGLDLAMLLAVWSIPPGTPGCGGAKPCPQDLNGDTVVNGFDLATLLAAWGKCPV